MHHFLVPGLFPPPASGWLPQQSVPALELVLARGDREAGSNSAAEALFTLFEVAPDEQKEAPYCWLGLTGEPPGNQVIAAHPVHYRADRDRLLLFPVDTRKLSSADLQPWIRAFNDHFADEGLVLEVPDPSHWFLFCEQEVKASFTPLRLALEKGLEESMPEGEEASRWRATLNETQMLFYQLAGQYPLPEPVNGLWLEGGGLLPAPLGRSPRVEKGETNCLVRGLQRNAREKNPETVLWYWDELEMAMMRADAAGWNAALQALDLTLGELLSQGAELLLDSCDGRKWRWRPGMRRRFWRRRSWSWRRDGRGTVV